MFLYINSIQRCLLFSSITYGNTAVMYFARDLNSLSRDFFVQTQSLLCYLICEFNLIGFIVFIFNLFLSSNHWIIFISEKERGKLKPALRWQSRKKSNVPEARVTRMSKNNELSKCIANQAKRAWACNHSALRWRGRAAAPRESIRRPCERDEPCARGRLGCCMHRASQK